MNNSELKAQWLERIQHRDEIVADGQHVLANNIEARVALAEDDLRLLFWTVHRLIKALPDEGDQP